jgi:hypothetical protein
MVSTVDMGSMVAHGFGAKGICWSVGPVGNVLSGVRAAALGIDRYLTIDAADAVVRYLSRSHGATRT